ncbi:MAG: DUF3592 domain-containing protein [Chitinivibrionia bacterium]|nr:DUF3592 domain-containing protein [Chitinivibrionia bacterium]
MRDKLPAIILAFIFIAIGGYILRYGVSLIIRNFNASGLFNSNSIPAVAVINEIYRSDGKRIKSRDPLSKRTYTTVFMTFTDNNGNERKIQTSQYDFTMRTGMKIPIVYNANNPDEFVISGIRRVMHNFVSLILLCFFGLPFFVFGIMALKRIWRV